MNISVTFYRRDVGDAETHHIEFLALPVVGQKIFLKGDWYVIDSVYWVTSLKYTAKPYASAGRINAFDS